MGSVWSKIWGSNYPGCGCGIGYIANCHCCNLLSPECCDKCDPAGFHTKQCILIVADVLIILLLGVGLVVLSDSLLGGEESLNLFDDLGNFVEGGLKTVMSAWKNTMGEVHSTFYNLFNSTLKASSALSKLVAATLTAGLTLTLLDLFNGQLGKVKNECVGKFFDAFNTPITFLKATLYGFYKPLGYLADIFLFPFEFVVAVLALGGVAIWDVIKKLGPIAGWICRGSLNVCCNGVSDNSFYSKDDLDFNYKRRGGARDPELPANPPRGRPAPRAGVLPREMADQEME